MYICTLYIYIIISLYLLTNAHTHTYIYNIVYDESYAIYVM